MDNTTINQRIALKKVQLTPDGWTLNILSPRVATITNPLGMRKVSYFGFDKTKDAEKFQQYLLENHLCTVAVIRSSRRLAAPIECKAWGCSSKIIWQCAVKDLKQQNLSAQPQLPQPAFTKISTH